MSISIHTPLSSVYMHNIKNFMAGDHRQCDELLVTAEQAVASRSWDAASAAFAGFQHAVLQHFAAEESVLFPAFEAKTGMLSGPTQVMRAEHVQMRELMAAAREALLAQDADDYEGNVETLFIMMQQHNVKEENVLYPMCDQLLSAQVDTLLPRLQDTLQTPAD
jgi:hemerythrin-like domain-containing protein